MKAPAREAGQEALAALEQALGRQPERDGDAFSRATEALCRMRDALGREASGADRDHINGVISAVLAGHFPLGKTPWPLVETATQTLRSLLGTA